MVKKIVDWLKNVQAGIIVIVGLAVFISNILTFYSGNEDTTLGEIAVTPLFVTLLLLSFVLWAIGIIIGVQNARVRRACQKEIRRITLREDAVCQIAKDLGWERGCFEYNGMLFKIQPELKSFGWLEYAFEFNSNPRCPECFGPLHLSSDTTMRCRNQRCSNKQIIECDNSHGFRVEAREAMMAKIEDWKEINKDKYT